MAGKQILVNKSRRLWATCRIYLRRSDSLVVMFLLALLCLFKVFPNYRLEGGSCCCSRGSWSMSRCITSTSTWQGSRFVVTSVDFLHVSWKKWISEMQKNKTNVKGTKLIIKISIMYIRMNRIIDIHGVTKNNKLVYKVTCWTLGKTVKIP